MKLFYDVSTVETPEQLEISLPLAGIGTRFLAYAIDSLCQLIVIIAAIVFVLSYTGLVGSMLPKNPDDYRGFSIFAVALLNGVIFATNFFYFAVFELLWEGQSPGKRALGLRVVRDGGFPVDGRSTLIRNLLRTVDFLPAFYVVGVISIFVGRHGKRVGDYAAGTIVIREQKHAAAEAGDPNLKVSNSLTPAEAALVEQFFERMLDFEPAARQRLASDLANRLAQKYGKPLPKDSLSFLSSFLKNENH